jgi:hypothetical protein
MSFKTLIVLMAIALVGCVKSEDESIYMLCEGIETLKVLEKGYLESESRKVNISVQLKKVKRIFGYDSTNSKAESKEVWVLIVDNTREIFESANLSKESLKIENISKNQNTLVSPNEIVASQQINITSDDKSLEKFESFHLNINRVSGEFNIGHIENYKQDKISYRRNVKGVCVKSVKKI